MYPYNGYPYYYVQHVPPVNQIPVNHYAQVNPNLFVQQTRRPTVQQVMQLIRSEHSNLITQLEQAGLTRQIIDTLFFLSY